MIDDWWHDDDDDDDDDVHNGPLTRFISELFLPQQRQVRISNILPDHVEQQQQHAEHAQYAYQAEHCDSQLSPSLKEHAFHQANAVLRIIL